MDKEKEDLNPIIAIFIVFCVATCVIFAAVLLPLLLVGAPIAIMSGLMKDVD